MLYFLRYLLLNISQLYMFYKNICSLDMHLRCSVWKSDIQYFIKKNWTIKDLEPQFSKMTGIRENCMHVISMLIHFPSVVLRKMRECGEAWMNSSTCHSWHARAIQDHKHMGDDSPWTRLKCSPCFWLWHKKIVEARSTPLPLKTELQCWKAASTESLLTANSRQLQSLNRHHHHAKTNALTHTQHSCTFQGAPCSLPKYLSFFLPMYIYLFCWSMPIYIHQCRTPPDPTSTL